MTAKTEYGLAVVEARRLAALDAATDPALATLARALGDDDLAAAAPEGACATHLYFGSEFCEHLFPDADDLARASACATRLGLTLVLATPAANDALVARILAAAAQLPPEAEILVNDWGVAAAVRAAQPQRRLVAGRQLAKMLKDPRLPTPAWMKPYASGYAAPGFRRVLAGLDIDHIELDAPPFAVPETFAVADLRVSIRAPFAYVAKGRLCKVGSLRLEREEKFAPGRPCHRECLGILETGDDPSPSGMRSYARGNGLYYRHGATQTAAVTAALAQGYAARLVLAGL